MGSEVVMILYLIYRKVTKINASIHAIELNVGKLSNPCKKETCISTKNTEIILEMQVIH
jgi:hypothetical protein